MLVWQIAKDLFRNNVKENKLLLPELCLVKCCSLATHSVFVYYGTLVLALQGEHPFYVSNIE